MPGGQYIVSPGAPVRTHIMYIFRKIKISEDVRMGHTLFNVSRFLYDIYVPDVPQIPDNYGEIMLADGTCYITLKAKMK
jgi:hypothetical protein